MYDLKSRLIESFSSRKFHMFGVFLVLSFIFLVLTKFSKTYTERIYLTIDYENLPDDVAITLKEPKQLRVDVETVGFRILAYYFKNKTVKIDLEEDVLIADSSYVYLPTSEDRSIRQIIGNEVEIKSVRPDTVLIPFSVLNTKRVPIKINEEITLASGYDYRDSLRVEPDSVDVIGPSSIVNEISEISTELISYEEVSNNLKERIDLNAPENKKIKLGEYQTNVVIDIAKFTEGTVQVPITILNLPKNLKINYFPKTVPVSYYVNLNNFNDIDAEDFEVICDYNQVKNSDKLFFIPTLGDLPDMVRSARIKQEKIEYIITK